MRFLVRQHHIGAKFLVEVHRAEVEEGYEINGIDAISPCRPSFALPGNGLGNVVDTAVLEIGLRLVLHLHNDVLACVGLAIDVKNERSVILIECRLFFVEKRDILDVLLALHEAVEEVDYQGL